MRATRTTLLVLVVLALVLPLAATAGAKPNRPPVQPVYYQVELTPTGDNGLATTCPGPITMEFGNSGYKAGSNTDPAELAITAGITWSRLLPTPGSGAFSGECHGSQINDPPPAWPAILQITADPAGNPTGLVWHFDYYATQTTYGKDRVRAEALEWLTLRSLCAVDHPEYDCYPFAATELTSDGSGTRSYDVSGTFTLYRWYPADSPNPEFQGSSFLQFTMTFTPVPVP